MQLYKKRFKLYLPKIICIYKYANLQKVGFFFIAN